MPFKLCSGEYEGAECPGWERLEFEHTAFLVDGRLLITADPQQVVLPRRSPEVEPDLVVEVVRYAGVYAYNDGDRQNNGEQTPLGGGAVRDTQIADGNGGDADTSEQRGNNRGHDCGVRTSKACQKAGSESAGEGS